MAKSIPFWNVHPRYSGGSPAALFRDEALVHRIVDEEKRSYQAALEGFYGEEQQARAERLGLRGIVVLTREKGKKWVCHDLVTDEHYDRPFDDRMRKAGFVRFNDLQSHIQELIAKCEPAVAKEAAKDARPFWFRQPEVHEFWNPVSSISERHGGYDDPKTPSKLMWEPEIKPTYAD